MSSSISRQLVLWLAVPLMLLALCGALLHYFNNVAPSVISRDQRLREASNALMARIEVKDGQIALDAAANGKAPLPSADSVTYAVRDARGRLLLGDAQLPAVSIADASDQVFALARLGHRNVRTLTSRFDTAAGVLLLSTADVRASNEPAARSARWRTRGEVATNASKTSRSRAVQGRRATASSAVTAGSCTS